MPIPLIGTLFSFLLIIGMASRKTPLHLAVISGTVLVGLSCGLTPVAVLAVAWQGLRDPATLELISVIALICISSYLLQRFQLLKRAVEDLDRLLPTTKLTIMLVPMLIGLLTVAGGAIISAPMVDQLGNRLQLEPHRRAAINLLYRHAGHFMFPFVPGIIMASQLGGFPATSLAALMSPVTLVLLLGGYFFLLRDITTEPPREDAASRRQHALADLAGFLLNASPILLPLLLSIVLGMKFTLALALGIALAVALIWWRQQKVAQELPPLQVIDLVMGLYEQRKLLFAATSIMIFRGMIISTNVLTPYIGSMLAAGIPLSLLAVVFPFLMGSSTGQIASAIGICWPILISPGFTGAKLPLAMLMYISGYLGYFFSPLHLCTVLTNGYFKVEISSSYKELAPIFIPLPPLMAALYFFFH
ncbi:MAG: DUF401 family protein [Symbiobacteriaceae bacterium]|nr:DUF401 family protein [Symbiobacteriaceae bacterium]